LQNSIRCWMGRSIYNIGRSEIWTVVKILIYLDLWKGKKNYLYCYKNEVTKESRLKWLELPTKSLFILKGLTEIYYYFIVKMERYWIEIELHSLKIDKGGQIRPVLKHGPRSLTCMRVKGIWIPKTNSESDIYESKKSSYNVLLCNSTWKLPVSIHDGTRKMLN